MENPVRNVTCVHCGSEMQYVKVEQWNPSNLLLKQLQKIADHAGVSVYHCKTCGKVEFFKQPATEPPAK